MSYLPVLALFLVVAQGEVPGKKDEKIPDGLKALTHSDPAVRYKAAAVLVRLGPVAKFAVPELRQALKDTNGYVRVKAAEALWAIDKTSPKVLLPVLVQALGSREPQLRTAAAAVLGTLGPKATSAVPVLIKVLQDREESVQIEAAMALGEIGPAARDAAPALLQLVRAEGTSIIEPFVVTALASIGPDVVPDLGKALGDNVVARRRVAADVLGKLGPDARAATAALLAALRDSDAVVRGNAARALGRIGAKMAAAPLKGVLDDPDVSNRVKAVLAIWQIEGRVGQVGILIMALGDRDGTLRLEAAEALGQIGPAAAQASDGLRKLLADEDSIVRMTSAYALWQVNGKADETLRTLGKGLKDEDRAVRRSAAFLLGKIGNPAQPLVPMLIEGLQDEDADVRAAVKEALKKIDR